jgi:outer membrane receptor protein involved in Fe transport
MDGYEVFDLGVGGKLSAFNHTYDVSLQAKNVFDKTYLENRFYFAPPLSFVFTVTTRF